MTASYKIPELEDITDELLEQLRLVYQNPKLSRYAAWEKLKSVSAYKHWDKNISFSEIAEMSDELLNQVRAIENKSTLTREEARQAAFKITISKNKG